MLVRAVLAPQRADDAKLGERRLAAEHGDQAIVLVGRESVLGDERGSDAWIARACGNVHGVCGGVEDDGAGFIVGDATGMDGDASAGLAGGFMRIGALLGVDFDAALGDTDSGELLVPV